MYVENNFFKIHNLIFSELNIQKKEENLFLFDSYCYSE